MTPEARREAFIMDNVADIAPVPCGFEKGDLVTFTNEYGVAFHGLRVLGFVREIDRQWRPDSIVYLDKSSYWFPVEVASLTLEKRAKDEVIIPPAVPDTEFCM